MLARTAEALGSRQAEHIHMDGVGHSAYVEAPGRFNEALLAFIDNRAQWDG